MRRRPIVLLVLTSALLLSGVPAGAQGDTPSATPEPLASAQATQVPSVSRSGRPDLYLKMPYYIGGFEPDIVMTRGEEHFANLDVGDPKRAELESLLETVGAEADDLVSGYALVSQEDFFSFVVAIRVDGIDTGHVAPCLPAHPLRGPRGSAERRHADGRPRCHHHHFAWQRR